MPELRHNLITGDWVILSSERAQRPDCSGHSGLKLGGAPPTGECPFCPGNEHLTPGETARVEAGGTWVVRAVPNRYPALSPLGAPVHLGSGYTRSMAGVGLHEVLVESPLHDNTTALLSPDAVRDVLWMSRARMQAFYDDPRVEHVIIFKNHGEPAGSSISHPHSQVVGMPVVPGQIRVRIEQSQRHYDQHGRCLTCHCLEEELAARVRVIEENEHFAAFVPYAALSPFHIWILPKYHRAYFGAIADEELSALSLILRQTMRRIYHGLGNPPFNYVVRSQSPREAQARHLHWYLSVIVRLSKAAGFELGTGMFINTGTPEQSARFLREVSPAY